MSENSNNPRSPLSSLLYLILYVIIGALVFTILGFLIGGFFYGFDANTVSANLGFLRILQIVSSIGSFIIPAWVFAKSENQKPASYFKLNTPFYPLLAILTVSVMFSSSAIFEWLVEWNQRMHLPDFLRGLEQWMRLQEDKMAELVKQLSLIKSPSDLIITLLMMALIPALGRS